MRKPNNFRRLSEPEKAIARSVYERTVPYSRVVLCDGLGIDNRPFCMPAPGEEDYLIFVGPHYPDMTQTPYRRWLLIHELVHVWQGEHASWRWKYVVDSVNAQRKGDAYKYDPNNLKSWKSYNPEQQGDIVADWYADGMSESDPRFPFIRFWIRGDRSLGFKLKPPPTKSMTRVSSKASEDRIPSDVLFDFDSARLRRSATPHLKKVAAILRKHVVMHPQAQGRTVIIEGHTDSIGSATYNKRLSERRANAVKNALITLGVQHAQNFQAKGYGETKPIAPNSTLEGRRENRRVEFNYKYG